MFRPALATALAIALLGAAAPASGPTLVANPHLAGATRVGPDGSTLRYYVRPPKSAPAATAPIVLWLVGSGCNAAFRLKDGKLRDTLYALVRARRPATIRRIPGAEHDLVAPGGGYGEGADAYLRGGDALVCRRELGFEFRVGVTNSKLETYPARRGSGPTRQVTDARATTSPA